MLPIPISSRLLDLRQRKQRADAALHGVPLEEGAVLVPGEEANPGLDVVVEAQADVFEVGDLAGGVGDFVLWSLVLVSGFVKGGDGREGKTQVKGFVS